MILGESVKAILLLVIATYNYFLPVDLMPPSPVDNTIITVLAAFAYGLLIKRDIQDLDRESQTRIIPYEIFLFMTIICMAVVCEKYEYPEPEYILQDMERIKFLLKLLVIQYCLASFMITLRLKRVRRVGYNLPQG